MKTSPISLQKKRMRLKFRTVLSGIAPQKRNKKSLKIIRDLFKEKIFRDAKIIFTYVSLPEEVQTRVLIKKALRLGKQVFAPKMKPRSFRFEIYEIKDVEKGLKKGKHGVWEPLSRKKISLRKLDLMIVPGLAFDKKGNRLGRGGGTFDRFLEKAKGIPKIGLAFKEQKMRKIPVEKHDVPMDDVIYG